MAESTDVLHSKGDTGSAPLTRPVRLGVLISGRGSNLQALTQAAGSRLIDATLGVVISNVAEAPGLRFAQANGIETVVLPHRDYVSRDAYDRALVTALRSRGVEMVCLAGFMRLLGAAFCDAFPNAVLNVHPSLLPAFPGVDAQRQALEHGVRVTGATVHFVTPGLDDGPIVIQRAVPVLEGDTVESLSARILQIEHEIYPEAVRLVSGGRWRVVGRRVLFDTGSGATR